MFLKKVNAEKIKNGEIHDIQVFIFLPYILFLV